jgi:hypothetical protein
MTGDVLSELVSEGFLLEVGFLSTAGSVRRFLARSRVVADIRKALRDGTLTERDLRHFVTFLMHDLRAGERFEHEMAVAAIAVALERRATAFAEEYLGELARVKVAEMCLCSRVARECLKHRDSVAGTRRREWSLLPMPSTGEPATNGASGVFVATDVDTSEAKVCPIGEAA